MASNHRFFIMQNLLTLLIAWSSGAHVCSWEIVMKLPPSYGPDNRVGDEIFYNFTATDGLYFGFPAASTSPTPPMVYLSTRRIDLPFSGHGNSAFYMASNHRFFIMQNLLTLLIAWSAAAHVCSWEIVMKLPPSYGPDNRVGDELFYNFTATDGLYFGFPAASTSPTPPVVYLSTRRIDLPFSGHGNSALCMASNHRFFIMQVCTRFSLYAEKSDDPFLLLFPCPKVLYKVVCDCFSMIFSLLRSGDVETNPGPNTRSENLLDIDSLPENPAEHMKGMFKLLKDIHSRSLQSSKVQTELAADVKAIKNGQKNRNKNNRHTKKTRPTRGKIEGP
ncbi:uncharacterized protein LOC119162968 isoform X1 [Rhipicephalus microplus]|uniref:uncharacterized protein LOC119162968 isoform X1 n=1 Tax=Rhipicephalus microplus TaxID=6941 RepID=UPI003F6B80EE